MDSSTPQPSQLSEKEIISNYMRELAKKSHKVVKAKYGKDHYSRMGKKARSLGAKIK
jgi:3-methyladenine DNA glycosylase AlkC